MNERIKELRISFGISQEEFGNRIGIRSRAHISALENGNRNITDRIISDICREFDVSENWLRTGEGEMFIALSEVEEFAAYAGKIAGGHTTKFEREFLLLFGRMSTEDKKVMERFACDLVDAIRKEDCC